MYRCQLQSQPVDWLIRDGSDPAHKDHNRCDCANDQMYGLRVCDALG